MKPFLRKLQRQQAPIEIFGECWGGENIVEKYREAPKLNDFLSLAVKSSGDWLLLDQEQGVLITAPGFSGCYLDVSQEIVARNVNLLVANRIKKGLPLLNHSATSWWLSRDIISGINAYPVSSPFSEIRSLVGATVVHFGSEPLICEGYLNLASSSHNPPNVFEHSLLDACSQINRPICLLFSGGKDCLSIAIALREAGVQAADLRLVYVDARSIANAMRRKQAEIAAKAAGFELEIIVPDGGWWAWEGKGRCNDLQQLLSTTIVEPLSPFHCLERQQNDALIIDGQNMDAMLTLEMKKPPQEFPSLFKNLRFWFFYVFRDVVGNFRYTKAFQRSRLTRSMIHSLEIGMNILLRTIAVNKQHQLAKVSRNEIHELVAALLRRHPFGSIDVRSDFDAEYLVQEVDELLRLGKGQLRESWFYMYPAMASMLGHGQFANVHRFPNQGAFSPVWCRDIRIMDAVSPKFEIRDFLKKRLKSSYTQAISGWRNSAVGLTEKRGDGRFAGLHEFRDMLNLKDSALLDCSSSSYVDRLREDLERVRKIDECNGSAKKEVKERRERVYQGLRYLNIECILREANKLANGLHFDGNE